MVPLVAEKPILVKFYGKTKRFSNAVDEMKSVIANMEQEANQKNAKEMEAELEKRIQNIKQNPGNVVLTKLKGNEINRWCKSKCSRPKNRCLKPAKLTMKLRKR